MATSSLLLVQLLTGFHIIQNSEVIMKVLSSRNLE